MNQRVRLSFKPLISIVFLAFLLLNWNKETLAQIIKSQQKISITSDVFSLLSEGDFFGQSITNLGDLDGDDVPDLAVGASGNAEGDIVPGAVWILFMNTDGTVKRQQKITANQAGFTGELQTFDAFGFSVDAIGDLDDDGIVDLAVGAVNDTEGSVRGGAVWILFLQRDGTVKASQKINAVRGGFTDFLPPGSAFGTSITSFDDLDGDGVIDLAVGAARYSELNTIVGAVWVLYMRRDGTVKSHRRITATLVSRELAREIRRGNLFGISVAAIPDLDNDGVMELAVGIPGGGENTDVLVQENAILILFLQASGAIKSFQKIGPSQGGFPGVLEAGDSFGASLSVLEDFDGDNIADVVVGAPGDDDSALDAGAAWLLLMQADGTVKSTFKVSASSPLLTLPPSSFFGVSVGNAGDINQDGVPDLAIGAPGISDAGISSGAIGIFSIRPSGDIGNLQFVSATTGGFSDRIGTSDLFGISVAAIGDVDGDEVVDLAVGATGDDDGSADAGAVWVLFMQPDGVQKP